ncbi:recombination-associated protein RdgC [Piscinibacter sp.]|jgi:recombination associated protein RdgC|uniref:recombination-associated protein RdgC n=1 Tax=Piscinibacter sp. TaxID=1903157 RepID=UPI002F409812
MFKNALVYRIGSWDPASMADIEDRLAGGRFMACGATQPESAGWIEPRGEKYGALVENVGGQLILQLCVERKPVPGSVVKAALNERLEKIEAETGRRPKGKQAKELKEEIVHALLPRAFPKRSRTLIWVDPKAGLVLVDAAGMKKADAIVTQLVELLGGGIVLTLLQTQTSPATAMSEWLKTKEAPPGFSVDRECELKQPDSEKASVKYSRHTLDIDEVGEHIAQGKLPTQLAMTWAGRVSFVLTESMTLKKIKLLDVVLEGAGASPGQGDNGFDADVAIATGELGQLIPELIDALGGELVRESLQGGSEVRALAAKETAVAA